MQFGPWQWNPYFPFRHVYGTYFASELIPRCMPFWLLRSRQYQWVQVYITWSNFETNKFQTRCFVTMMLYSCFLRNDQNVFRVQSIMTRKRFLLLKRNYVYMRDINISTSWNIELGDLFCEQSKLCMAVSMHTLSNWDVLIREWYHIKKSLSVILAVVI